MKKTPPKKRVMRNIKPRSNVDPTRMAHAALERIKTVLVQSGYEERLGAPVSMKELAAQTTLLGTALPPSYVATLRLAGQIGDPDRFLLAEQIEDEVERLVTLGGEEARRYAPFCKGQGRFVCFDKGGEGGARVVGAQHPGELPVIEWRDGLATPVAVHFGEWLDSIADAREESVESAAKLPQRLKRLLYELGFRFEYPVVGRLETGDIDAIVALIGKPLAKTIRGDVERLFDSSGRASLSLNVDEFTLAVSLRTGIYVFEAEDIFRWLRTFRDENFFSESATSVPSHPDHVRDLRRAAREAPLVRRGVLDIAVLPAKQLTFRAASGTGADDFYLLGRTSSRNDRAPSVLLHVSGGAPASARNINEPLNDIYVARDGTIWGLTTTHVVRLEEGGRIDKFPIPRPTRGRAWWYGIGGTGDRVLVWGAGSLLEFVDGAFVAFDPDANLDESESVVALHADSPRIWMLVCGDHVGAVARYDGKFWLPITKHQVIEAALADLDYWRGISHVLDREHNVWKIDGSGPPQPVALLTYHQAYRTEQGSARPLHGIRAHDDGILLASNGGVLSVGGPEPLFHAIPNASDPVRLVRVGRAAMTAKDDPVRTSIVALGGSNVWIWKKGGFSIVDLRSW